MNKIQNESRKSRLKLSEDEVLDLFDKDRSYTLLGYSILNETTYYPKLLVVDVWDRQYLLINRLVEERGAQRVFDEAVKIQDYQAYKKYARKDSWLEMEGKKEVTDFAYYLVAAVYVIGEIYFEWAAGGHLGRKVFEGVMLYVMFGLMWWVLSYMLYFVCSERVKD